MPILHKKTYIYISPGIYIALCVLLLVFPVEWVLAWVVVAAIHELSHYIVLNVCRIRILSIQICYNGAKIITEPTQAWKEGLAALAGPVSGIALLLVAHWFPKLAVCALFQTGLNLLPIREFDGGRIFNCILRLLFGDSAANRISTVIEYVSLSVVFCVGIYTSLHYKTGLLLPSVTAILILRRFRAKTPCKAGKQIVQCTQPNIRGSKHE